MKTERSTESAQDSEPAALSNYHIKTLMLWACEQKPRSWWTDKLSFTAICVELLHLLSDWLAKGQCPHYFITGCNLFDGHDHSSQVRAAGQLKEINQTKLIQWFLDKYLQQCPLMRLFDAASTREKLQMAVSEAVEWREISEQCDSCFSVDYEEIRISSLSLNVHSYTVWKNELSNSDTKLGVYFFHLQCCALQDKYQNVD